MSFNLQQVTRSHLKGLRPYSTARDEYNGNASVYLDANENPFNSLYNRYPDPSQQQLKGAIAKIKQVDSENILLGNGSDEIIDLLIRAFCEPGDNVIIPQPTYGMYAVSAGISNVTVKTPLLTPTYDLDSKAVLGCVDNQTKLIFLCSPNNPSGNLLSEVEIISLLKSFDGIIALDEAYIDFSGSGGFLPRLDRYPNLVLLQTFSKAWGLAGIRLGVGYASKEIINLLTKIKPPYNINAITQKVALNAISGENKKTEWVKVIIEERVKLATKLVEFRFVKKVFHSDANFILAEFSNSKEVYNFLLNHGIIVRDRSETVGCKNCLRISIGTPQENEVLLNALIDYEKSIIY